MMQMKASSIVGVGNNSKGFSLGRFGGGVLIPHS
jgi:hypothetical protein